MGDLQFSSRQPDGLVSEEDRLFPSPESPPLPASSPDPLLIGEDVWEVAERAAQEVVCSVQPTWASEQKRKDVIEYVQRLIRCCLGLEVFAYGSVPLKTFLPDGDIDLTALSSANAEDVLARDVLAVLQGEEHNEQAEYEVKDTQFIDAEVKLVKCLVQNIVIDISFNQLGGLCTLCFLEQVDRLVGKDHLFKRSIILIKAWCYYESRILGAHHGLISTYALETLVLYIFHLFHSSLNGPLAVLYSFLDYFSKFDWENYCISLNGPVCKSSLPDIVVELPENYRNGLMLSEEFLRNCVDMFSVPPRGQDTSLRAFPQKHLNIIDPLKENNNLGRSVHRGNFYRIRSAFKYGARKLGNILQLPSERIADEIVKFFANTMERKGSKFGADIQIPALVSVPKESGTLSSSFHSETYSEDEMRLKSSSVDFDNTASRLEGKHSVPWRNELDKCSAELASFQMTSEADEIAVPGHPVAGDVSSRIANDTSDFSHLDNNSCGSFTGQYYYAPYFYFSGSYTENGTFENGDVYHEKQATSADWKKMGMDSWLEHRDTHLTTSNLDCSCTYDCEVLSSTGSAVSTQDANTSGSFSLDFRERGLASITGDSETLNPLSDLSGDYDSHIRSLLYGLCCHNYGLASSSIINLPSPTSQHPNKKPWETVRRSMPVNRNFWSQRNGNSMALGQPFYPVNLNSFGVISGSEDKLKPRGTGTYIPISNGPCRGRALPRKVRNQGQGGNHGQLMRNSHNRGVALAPFEHKTYSCEDGGHELPHPQFPVQGRGKSGLSRNSRHPDGSNTHGNGFHSPSENLEFGSLGHLGENNGSLTPGTSPPDGVSTPSLASTEMENPKPVKDSDQERVIIEQSYYLKNEEDFPPLSI